MDKQKREVIVIGGGLAGLVSSLLLAKDGHKVLLIEKKVYPFHRVCGEYVSNEVLDFLTRSGLLPDFLELPQISQFQFSDTKGQTVRIPLDLGGFGISRYVMDEWLYQLALEEGVEVKTGIQVSDLTFDPASDLFQVQLSDFSTITAKYVLGAFGKRSKLDKVLKRKFFFERSPYIGVKYHVKTDFDRETVALHNFDGGYCGINAIESGKFNLCYLGSRDQLRTYGSIEEMEREVLWKNPILKHIFQESEFLFEKPEVINEINFEPKQPVENHVLMIGDTAGLITPLCGNGMAMAIHSAKLAVEALTQGDSRIEVEQLYSKKWNAHFRRRLAVGRTVQKLFGSGRGSVLARGLIQYVPFAANLIMRNTHGQPF
ncbi:NAD(P)/FAD-dependent oxidoreductase [Algoriphagus aquatilis]|uniref:NAD(P)/FAD-dependent oxidoreductase n=1 Tax=Algoriphagus aquatilis TaxID=490186 RepID=A0ABW0BUZ6_9BACT